MTEQGWVSWLQALAQLDAALAEVAALRKRVAELTAERDTWRAKTGY